MTTEIAAADPYQRAQLWKRRFYVAVDKLYKNVLKCPKWTQERINYVIKMLEQYKDTSKEGKGAVGEAQYFAQRVEVRSRRGRPALVVKCDAPVFAWPRVVPYDDYYDELKTVHLTSSHGSPEKMLKIIKFTDFIPIPIIKMFQEFCPKCEAFTNNSLKPANVVTVDLISLEAMPAGEYKWVLHHYDGPTKYSILRPLKNRNPEEVAYVLFTIFTQFGFPVDLRTTLGEEYTMSVLAELRRLLPDDSEPLFQQHLPHGAVQGTLIDLPEMLSKWSAAKGPTWDTTGLFAAQYELNVSTDQYERSPFAEMFGRESHVGINRRLRAGLEGESESESPEHEDDGQDKDGSEDEDGGAEELGPMEEVFIKEEGVDEEEVVIKKENDEAEANVIPIEFEEEPEDDIKKEVVEEEADIKDGGDVDARVLSSDDSGSESSDDKYVPIDVSQLARKIDLDQMDQMDEEYYEVVDEGAVVSSPNKTAKRPRLDNADPGPAT